MIGSIAFFSNSQFAIMTLLSGNIYAIYHNLMLIDAHLSEKPIN